MSADNLLYLMHFWILFLGIIFLTSSIILILLHKSEICIDLHAIFGNIGIIFLIIGLILLVGLNIAIILQILGIIFLIWVIVEAIGGTIAHKKKNQKMRKLHVLTGILAFMAIIVIVIIRIINIIALAL